MRFCREALLLPDHDYSAVLSVEPSVAPTIGYANEKAVRDGLAKGFATGQSLEGNPKLFRKLIRGARPQDQFLVHYRVKKHLEDPLTYALALESARAISRAEEDAHWLKYAQDAKLDDFRFGFYPGGPIVIGERHFPRVKLKAEVYARISEINKIDIAMLAGFVARLRYPLPVSGGLEESFRHGMDLFWLRLERHGDDLYLVDAERKNVGVGRHYPSEERGRPFRRE